MHKTMILIIALFIVVILIFMIAGASINSALNSTQPIDNNTDNSTEFENDEPDKNEIEFSKFHGLKNTKIKLDSIKVDRLKKFYDNSEESVYGTEESVFYMNNMTLEYILEKDNKINSITINGLTENDIDLVANVVMHEVGGIYGANSYVTITYADGQSITYSGSCILHKIHAQVLLNQYNSSLFPSSLASCIRTYWMPGLDVSGYYSRNNSTWQHCRQDVVDVLINGFTIPSNVYGATCDPYFASQYPGYVLYASVYWNTGWYSGTFYYYQYIG